MSSIVHSSTAFGAIVRATSAIRRLLSGANGHNGFDGACAKLFGQGFVTRVAVVSVVTNDFCHVNIVNAMYHDASVFDCLCKNLAHGPK